MKISTAAFRAAFAFAGRAASKQTTLDILRSVRLVAEDGKFTLACNNLHMFAEAHGECGPGSIACCVKADKLGHALNAAGDEIDIKVDKMLVWKSGSSRYTMGILPAADFPTPRRDGTPVATITDPQIVDHITRVSFACASKGPQLHTHGVGLESKAGELTATATDNHKLATLAISKGDYQDFSAIMHRDVVAALPENAAELHIFAQRAEFIYPNGVLVANLVEGKFPDWRRVMQITADETIRLSRPQLLGAIKAALPFDELASIHLVMKDGALRVEGVDHDETAEHTVVAVGPDLEVWFLSSTLAPALQAAKGEEVALQFAKDAHGRRNLLIEDGSLRCVSAPYGR